MFHCGAVKPYNVCTMTVPVVHAGVPCTVAIVSLIAQVDKDSKRREGGGGGGAIVLAARLPVESAADSHLQVVSPLPPAVKAFTVLTRQRLHGDVYDIPIPFSCKRGFSSIIEVDTAMTTCVTTSISSVVPTAPEGAVEGDTFVVAAARSSLELDGFMVLYPGRQAPDWPVDFQFQYSEDGEDGENGDDQGDRAAQLPYSHYRGGGRVDGLLPSQFPGFETGGYPVDLDAVTHVRVKRTNRPCEAPDPEPTEPSAATPDPALAPTTGFVLHAPAAATPDPADELPPGRGVGASEGRSQGRPGLPAGRVHRGTKDGPGRRKRVEGQVPGGVPDGGGPVRRPRK